jgi:Hydantoinase B/oxoprolinase
MAYTGTGPEVFANTNAPPAVTSSAVIYSLRCMVPADIPLNQVLIGPSNALVMPDEDVSSFPHMLIDRLVIEHLQLCLLSMCTTLYLTCVAAGLPAAGGDQDSREQHPVAQPRGSGRGRQCAHQPAGDGRHLEVLRGSGGISGVQPSHPTSTQRD